MLKKGFLASCPFCQKKSSSFNYCFHCGEELPQDVKEVPVLSVWNRNVALQVISIFNDNIILPVGFKNKNIISMYVL